MAQLGTRYIAKQLIIGKLRAQSDLEEGIPTEWKSVYIWSCKNMIYE